MNKFPLFHLSEDHYQAEVALSVLICFGNQDEKAVIKPKVETLRKEYLQGEKKNINLFDEVAQILNFYISEVGPLSELLQSYLCKSPRLLERLNKVA